MTRKRRANTTKHQRHLITVDSVHDLVYRFANVLRLIVETEHAREYPNISYWVGIRLGKLTKIAETPVTTDAKDLPKLVRYIIDALLDDYPYIFVFLEAACDRSSEPEMLKAIDGLIGNLQFVDIFLKEKLYNETLDKVPETSELRPELRERALCQIWEERLRERYGCQNVALRLTSGSVCAEYHLPLPDLLTKLDPMVCDSASILKFKVTLPPSIALPLTKPLEHVVDRQVVTGLGKSVAHISFSYRIAARTLLMKEFGIHRNVVDVILPNNDEAFQYFTLLSHVQAYISDNRGLAFLDEQEFAKAMGLHPESDTLRQLLGVFSLCPAMTPASWFLEKVKSRFTCVHGILPDNWANGSVFMTQVVPTADEEIKLNPIPAKYWNTQQHPDKRAAFTALGLDWSNAAGPFMFHATTLENAKATVGHRGIHPQVGGQRYCDFGHRESFYLTGDYDHCVAWANENYGHTTTAVIIYKVPQIPPTTNGTDLSGGDKIDQWKFLVRCSRFGTQHKEVRLADESDWIYGPESTFKVTDKQDPNWDPQPSTKMQLAIKQHSTAFLFNSYLAGMIIFPPSQ